MGGRVGDLYQAFEKEWMINKGTQNSQGSRHQHARWVWGFKSLSGFLSETKGAPNLALNAGSIASDFEKWAFAIISLTLQTVAIVLPAVSAYHWHWKKGSKHAPEYAYPCYLAGTLAVCLGVALCSRAIDLATQEINMIPARERRIRPIFHVQLSCTIGDQHFPATLIMNNNSNHGIRISRLLRVTREVRRV
jgi:hypothetical protein